jgi:hypothetical protein
MDVCPLLLSLRPLWLVHSRPSLTTPRPPRSRCRRRTKAATPAAAESEARGRRPQAVANQQRSDARVPGTLQSRRARALPMAETCLAPTCK